MSLADVPVDEAHDDDGDYDGVADADGDGDGRGGDDASTPALRSPYTSMLGCCDADTPAVRRAAASRHTTATVTPVSRRASRTPASHRHACPRARCLQARL
jgi:hypothetical protein